MGRNTAGFLNILPKSCVFTIYENLLSHVYSSSVHLQPSQRHQSLSSQYSCLPVTTGEAHLPHTRQSWWPQSSYFLSAHSSSWQFGYRNSIKPPSKHTGSLRDTDSWPGGKLSKPQIHIMLQWELSSNLAPSFKGYVTLGERFRLSVPLFPCLLGVIKYLLD